MNLITNNAKFIKLVSDNKIQPALKTYADSLLFYYIGYLSTLSSSGEFLEIGVGGSTYILTELSELCNRNFNVIDVQADRLSFFSDTSYFTNANNIQHPISSLELQSKQINSLAYCHIDGNKNYEIARSDLEFCLSNLITNGIICQVYGNNRWPMVTDVIQEFLHAGRLKILLIGDNSCWITLPEYYDYWLKIFFQDYEFNLLGKFLNITSTTKYFYMNSGESNFSKVNNSEFDYFDLLLTYNLTSYLQSPYIEQNTPGFHFRRAKRYKLNSMWNIIQGDSWPEAPVTTEDIDNLPILVKDEIRNLHGIHDLYAQESYYEKSCIRSNQPISGE